jgi:hypothetical protein
MAIQVHKENKVQQVLQVQMVIQDHKVFVVRKVKQEKKDRWEILV